MFAFVEHSAVMARGVPNPESPEQVGERLRITRAALGHTQATMCRLMGSSSSGQAWENYERGRRRISLDHALRLCARAGLSLPWIYQGDLESLNGPIQKKILVQLALEERDETRPSR